MQVKTLHAAFADDNQRTSNTVVIRTRCILNK